MVGNFQKGCRIAYILMPFPYAQVRTPAPRPCARQRTSAHLCARQAQVRTRPPHGSARAHPCPCAGREVDLRRVLPAVAAGVRGHATLRHARRVLLRGAGRLRGGPDLGSGISGQKMGFKCTRLVEPERVVWFQRKRYGIYTPHFNRKNELVLFRGRKPDSAPQILI